MITVLALIVISLAAAASFLVIADSGVRAIEALSVIKRELAETQVQITSYPSDRKLAGPQRAVASVFSQPSPTLRRAA